MARNNLARGSKLCKNESFLMNLKALRNSKDMLVIPPSIVLKNFY